MRWNCMSKALRFQQITAKHQDLPIFTAFLTIKTLSQNISITLLQISLKLPEHQGGCCKKSLPWTILEEQFPVSRNTAASKIGSGFISLLWQLRCHCNSDHNKVSSLSNTTVVLIWPNLCLWRRSLRSNVGGIHSKKPYRATLTESVSKFGLKMSFSQTYHPYMTCNPECQHSNTGAITSSNRWMTLFASFPHFWLRDWRRLLVVPKSGRHLAKMLQSQFSLHWLGLALNSVALFP